MGSERSPQLPPLPLPRLAAALSARYARELLACAAGPERLKALQQKHSEKLEQTQGNEWTEKIAMEEGAGCQEGQDEEAKEVSWPVVG